MRKHFSEIFKSTPAFKAKDYSKALRDTFLGIDVRLGNPKGAQELEDIHRALSSKANPVFGQPDPSDLANSVGCTACVAFITKTEIFVANAGDSRCVLSKSACAINMSVDHKPELEGEKRRIVHAGGTVEENRVNGILNLSRSLGDLDYKKKDGLSPEEQMITAFPEIRNEKIANETEFLILACDGVWDCLSSQEAVDEVKNRMAKSTMKGGLKLGKLLEEMLDPLIATDVGGKIM